MTTARKISTIDLFGRELPVAPSALRRSARITCRACRKPAEVPLDHPALLCALCLADLDGCEVLAATLRREAEARLVRAVEAFEATLAACDEVTRARWEKYEAAKAQAVDDEVLRLRIQRQRARDITEQTSLAALFAAETARDDEAAACNDQLERAARIWAELDAARADAPRAGRGR